MRQQCSSVNGARYSSAQRGSDTTAPRASNDGSACSQVLSAAATQQRREHLMTAAHLRRLGRCAHTLFRMACLSAASGSRSSCVYWLVPPSTTVSACDENSLY